MLGVNNYTSFEYNTLHKEIDKENENGIVEYSKFDYNVKASKYTELKSRYDIGGWNNWVQIYGNSFFMWFLPIHLSFASSNPRQYPVRKGSRHGYY